MEQYLNVQNVQIFTWQSCDQCCIAQVAKYNLITKHCALEHQHVNQALINTDSVNVPTGDLVKTSAGLHASSNLSNPLTSVTSQWNYVWAAFCVAVNNGPLLFRLQTISISPHPKCHCPNEGNLKLFRWFYPLLYLHFQFGRTHCLSQLVAGLAHINPRIRGL